MPCLAHIDPATGKSSHIPRNYKWVNDLKTDPEEGYTRARKHRSRGKGANGKNKDKDEDNSEAMDEDRASPEPKEGTATHASNPLVNKSAGAYHTFLETPIVRVKKSALRTLNATLPAVPQYVKWSENPAPLTELIVRPSFLKSAMPLLLVPASTGMTSPSAPWTAELA
jgi:hypothetical protein